MADYTQSKQIMLYVKGNCMRWLGIRLWAMMMPPHERRDKKRGAEKREVKKKVRTCERPPEDPVSRIQSYV